VNPKPDPDGALQDELRALIDRVDPVPAEVTEFARAALGWRRLDSDLAELLADSALDVEVAALTRSTGLRARWLTFRAAELSIDVEVQADGDERTLLGQLAPPCAGATVEVQAADGTAAATALADELGRFRLTLENGGRVRLRILRPEPGSAPVETSWLAV
jgi:hypothetical protein